MKTGNKHFFAIRSKYAHIFGDADVLDGKKILTGLLSTVYKLEQTKIDEILKDGAKPEDVLSAIVEADKERVKTLGNSKDTEKFQEGYKKAKKEVLTAFETSLKEEYGITSEKTGAELMQEIISAKASEGSAKTEDEIRKTPTYQALETKMKKDLKEAKELHDAKIKELETTHKKEGTFTTVGKSAIEILNGLNPVLPDNATVAETQKSDFLNELKGYEYEVQEDGKILVSKAGALMKDEHGHTLEWDDHVKKIAAKRFVFAANNGGENSGNKNDPKVDKDKGGKAEYPKNIKKPTNDTELAEVMKTLPVDQKRIVLDTYKAEHVKA